MPSDIQPPAAEPPVSPGERAFQLRRRFMSYGQIAAETGSTLAAVYSSVFAYWTSIERTANEPAKTVIDRELATLDALQRHWLPIALEEPQELVEDQFPEDVRRAETACPRRRCETALKALNFVLKISALRAKLLGLGPTKDAKPEVEFITIAEAMERLSSPPSRPQAISAATPAGGRRSVPA